MGRSRSNYICPKCGKQGYLEKNFTRSGEYWRTVHYDSFTKKRHRHYVDKIIKQQHYQKIAKNISDYNLTSEFSGTYDLNLSESIIPLKWQLSLKVIPESKPVIIPKLDLMIDMARARKMARKRGM